MTEKQGQQEIKYRLALLKIQKWLEDGIITQEEFDKLRKGLVSKYKPIIGCLDV